MTNPMFNPQPNYSGVTIQIANPAVNVNPYGTNQSFPQGVAVRNGNYAACPQACYYPNPQQALPNNAVTQPYETINSVQNYDTVTNPDDYNSQNVTGGGNKDSGYAQAYPASYYLNNYNTQDKGQITGSEYREPVQKEVLNPESFNIDENRDINIKTHTVDPDAGISPYRDYADLPKTKEPEDMTASKNIIGNLDERNAEIKEAKKNTKEQKIVALTDEYIMSLENYLNNPNDELRLMAAKEILTRLDEDKDRYDDAALNALLNKMLQDPSKLIRLAALSAFASQLASGNDYTVQLLQNIQSNPNADKEDALQAADILLKMSSGVEVKNVPVTEKREQYKMKPMKSEQV